MGFVPVRISIFERSSDDDQKCIHGTLEEGMMMMSTIMMMRMMIMISEEGMKRIHFGKVKYE